MKKGKNLHANLKKKMSEQLETSLNIKI